MPYTLGPRQTFEALPTAEYRLTLKSWEEITEKETTEYHKKGDVRNMYVWAVTVPGGEETERRDWVNVPSTFSEKSTFVAIHVALRTVNSAKAIDDGATIDPDQGIGRSCLGTIVKSLKKGSTTEWTDKITAYAPLPAEAAPAKSKTDMAAKLRERLNTLLAFSGETSDAPADLDQKALVNALKVIGAKPITAKATQYLTESIELANTMGINDFDDSAILGLTLKDALLLHEKVSARLDA